MSRMKKEILFLIAFLAIMAVVKILFPAHEIKYYIIGYLFSSIIMFFKDKKNIKEAN